VPPEAGGDAPALVTAKLSTAPAKNLTFCLADIIFILKEDLAMITAEMPRPKTKYLPDFDVEDIEELDVEESDEEYSEEFLEEIERETEKAFRQIDRGELKPIDLKAFALKHGVILSRKAEAITANLTPFRINKFFKKICVMPRA